MGRHGLTKPILAPLLAQLGASLGANWGHVEAMLTSEIDVLDVLESI